MVIYDSHDYPDDTKMIIEPREDGCVQLTLQFTSEDCDFGTEELIYAGNDGWFELASDLLEELEGYLDTVDISPFYMQQSMEIPPADCVYGEYTRTALYAFEAMLLHIVRGKEN